jgi:hypothetical protein
MKISNPKEKIYFKKRRSKKEMNEVKKIKKVKNIKIKLMIIF